MMLILQGFILGLLIAIPIGPIALICIQRTLTRGLRSGIISGMGATSVDIVYGAIALSGISAIKYFVGSHLSYFHLLGAGILIVWGWYIWKYPPKHTQVPDSLSYVRDFFSTFFLTLCNPITILFFPALFAQFHPEVSVISATLFLISLSLGSFLWWVILCKVTKTVETKVHGYFRLINKGIALVILLLGSMYLIKTLLVFLH